eukprot:scaffold153868_cov36-Tisochrysis_lutea.AAC.4
MTQHDEQRRPACSRPRGIAGHVDEWQCSAQADSAPPLTCERELAHILRAAQYIADSCSVFSR